MTNADYNTLQCRIKALQGQVDRLISGKEYQKLREQHSKDVAYYCGEIDRLKKDLEASRKETIRVKITGCFAAPVRPQGSIVPDVRDAAFR